MINEEDARKQVKLLRRFYMDGFTFAIVNAILILIWFVVDRSATFWPKYVIVIWGSVFLLRAYQMGLMPLFFHHFSFLTSEWEEKKIKELTNGHKEQKRVHLNRDKKK